MAVMQQAMKLRSNESYAGGNSGLATAWYKVEFDADFDFAQWVISCKVASGTPGTYKVAMAVTDQILVDTPTNAFVPMRAGVAYNDNSANGWQNATFGGATTKTIGLAPSAENNSAISIITDLMTLKSLPRADGKPGGILLVKVVQLTAGAAYSTDSSSDEGWNNMPRQGLFREFFCRRGAGVDGIAALTVPGSVTPASSGFSIMGYPVVTSTTSTKPTELVLFTGDSRRSAAFSGFNAPNRKAAMSLSTGAHPVSIVNLAGSGHGQSQYLQVAKDALDAGLKPTVISIPGFSQNNFTTFAAFKAANDNFMAAVRALPGLANVKWIIDTDYYVTGYSGTARETERQQCIAYAKSLHNGTTVFCFDSDALFTDYTNPSAPTHKSAYYNAATVPPTFTGGDGTHLGPTGLEVYAYGDGANPGLQSTYRTALGMDTPVADTTSPAMVGAITVSAITTSGATLSCPAATDAVGVAGYEYSIDGGASYTVIPNAARSVVVSGRPAGTAHAVRMRAFDAAGNRATPLSASFTTLAEQPAQNAVVASTVAESRRVAFPGGTRVVAFGSVPGARTPNAPYLEGGKWWSEKHPLDERYWVANITIDLAERGTTAKTVEAIVAGVTVLQDPVIQGKLIPVKLGGFNAATGAVNFCTFRVTCANGERFDRTIWFKQQVGVYSLNKDADDQSYYVGDIGNDLADSNTTATAVKALPVGVEELVPAAIQGPLVLVKLGGMDTLPAGVNYCDLRIDCANSERFYRTIQFNRVDN